MTKTGRSSKKSFQKTSHFIRNTTLFERRKNGYKKTSEFKWFIDESKYLKENEVKRLLVIVGNRKKKAEKKGQKIAVRNYYLIKVGLSTGLRVQEMADLKCSDFHLGDRMSYVLVRNGKCGKSRVVWFNGNLKQDIKDYLQWKEKNEGDISPEVPFFLSSNTKSHISTRTLQRAFKRTIEEAGINLEYSIHATRHTYATHLLKVSNIVFVKDQLGHSSIKTTEVYTHVTDEDKQKALERLYV